uniref:cytochrome b n=1 Tax=Craseoa lathetica TaxID=316205 RepID=UPI0026E3B20C|nr:cytochrome b [Craseoa lathetica]WJJ70137.1 cytochrome b [Craseoa lathetica]
MRFRKSNPLLSQISSLIIELPTPVSLSYLWNFGSLLGLCLIIQIITGIFLAMHYCPSTFLAFSSLWHIGRDVNYGYLLKLLHANGASLFFVCLYIHIGRGLYYGSFLRKSLWFSGVILFLLTMVTAFIGYVLPWGQMSFWGATVITNFISAIPYIGNTIVMWVWGGFSVGNSTLNRFFSLHYLFPFILIGLVIIHIILLHVKGSNSPLGINTSIERVSFHLYYTWKDAIGFLFLFLILFCLIFFAPNLLAEPENFIKANSLVTPVHIMPEWYFLFAYAILRAIPNKLGGVVGLVLSILVLLILPFINYNTIKTLTFKPYSRLLYWTFISNFILLTWIGSKPVEEPFIILGQFASLYYFLNLIVLSPLIFHLEHKILYKTN